MSVAEARGRDGKHPLDWLLDLALAEDLETMFIATLLNTDEAALTRMLTDDNALISLSDAGAHLEFFCDAGAGLHLLGHWVRERGIMSIERAVHRLTAETAEAFGIPDRGRIAPGAWADLALFDPATVGRGPAHAPARPAERRVAPGHARARHSWRLGEWPTTRGFERSPARCAAGRAGAPAVPRIAIGLFPTRLTICYAGSVRKKKLS